MIKASDVDVCVTCISNKAPQLPLREELPSLGVEVVYGARGAGMRATADESKKKLRRFRRKEQIRSLIRHRKQNGAAGPEQREEIARMERQIQQPTALSYKTYEKHLAKIQHQTKPPNAKKSTRDRANDKQKNRQSYRTTERTGSQESRRQQPPISPGKMSDQSTSSKNQDNQGETIHIENALNEAFKAFSASPVAASLTSEKRKRNLDLITSKRLLEDQKTLSRKRDPPASHIPGGRPPALKSKSTKHGDVPTSLTKGCQKPDPAPIRSVPNTRQCTEHKGTAPSSRQKKKQMPHIETEKTKPKPTISDSESAEFFDNPKVVDNENVDSLSMSTVNLPCLWTSKGLPNSARVESFSSLLMGSKLPGRGAQTREQKNVSQSFLDSSVVKGRPSLPTPLSAESDFREDNSLHGWGMTVNEVSENRLDDSLREEADPSPGTKGLERDKIGPKKNNVDRFDPGTNLNDESELSERKNARYLKEKARWVWPFFRRGASPHKNSLSEMFQSTGPRQDKKKVYLSKVNGAEFSGVHSPFCRQNVSHRTNFEELIEDVKTHGDFEANPVPFGPRVVRNGRYLIHEFCCRQFPDRSWCDSSCSVADLVEDILCFNKMLKLLHDKDPDACTLMDNEGNLPVHLLSRLLIEWETSWYQKVYSDANDSDRKGENEAEVSKLYQMMSQCVDLLLKAVATRQDLCTRGGSIGKLLPLHIAIMFTVSYNTLYTLLETYPDATADACDLSGIRTFIPNELFALQLHDRLSTDFPTWERSFGKGAIREEPISEPAQKVTTGQRLWRSDLIFAFCPNVLPYCHDLSRLERAENIVSQELETSATNYELSPPVARLWIWLCSFVVGGDMEERFSTAVRRIIEPLPVERIKELVNTPTTSGTPLFDQARPSCQKIVIGKLNDLVQHAIAVPMEPSPRCMEEEGRSVILHKWERDNASRCCLRGRGFIGVVLRSLFNIKEETFPTSFVLLPYKLGKDKGGKFGLENPEAASIALDFADCLLRLTSPSVIGFFLQDKFSQSDGRHSQLENNDSNTNIGQHAKEVSKELLALYQRGEAYFYFLDEYSGTPVVPEQESIYPFALDDSFDFARKILTLMLPGMILMRGHKAYGIIVEVLRENSRKMLQTRWREAAKDLLGFVLSPRSGLSIVETEDLLPMKGALLEVLEGPLPDLFGPIGDHKAQQPHEWVVELSLLKMVVEMHDPNKTLAGLRPKRGMQMVLWTEEAKISCQKPDTIKFCTLQEIRDNSNTFKVAGKSKTLPNEEIHHGCSKTLNTSGSAYSAGLSLLFAGLSSNKDPTTSLPTVMDVNDEKLLRQNSSRDRSENACVPYELRMRGAATVMHTTALNFDQKNELDEERQLRILLDEQEAKLEFFKKKVNSIQEAEVELLRQEGRIGEMMKQINGEINPAMQSATNRGLSKARNLLIRICELETRVLCKEVEMGELNKAISSFNSQAREEAHPGHGSDNGDHLLWG
eukprot:scaffold4634_cov122-Cylindrotheca_fusiformis.AAC.5